MRKAAAFFAVILACGLLFGGCAKQELVKKDDLLSSPDAASAGRDAGDKAKKDAAGAGQAVAETRIQEPVVKTEIPAQTSAADTLALETVYFDYDSYVLLPQAREMLTKDAAILRKNARVRIQIEGHCDERGSDEYNLALGEKRAKAARDYLTALGVDQERISIISYGKEKPVDPGHDETAWAKNRRAVPVLQK